MSRMMVDERAVLLEEIQAAFAPCPEPCVHALVGLTIERLQTSSESVARVPSAGLEARQPDLVGSR